MWIPEKFKYFEICSAIVWLIGGANGCSVSSGDVRFYYYATETSAGTEVSVSDWSALEHVGTFERLSVVIHGYTETSLCPDVQEIKNACYTRKINPSTGVIMVDYRKLSCSGCGALETVAGYPGAALCVCPVAAEVSAFLQVLREKKIMDASKTEIIGFSLGAHIAGCTGATFETATQEKISKIFALDPAGPLFSKTNDATLKPTDAANVIVIHTSGILGNILSLGHCDLFGNWFISPQPTCADRMCYNINTDGRVEGAESILPSCEALVWICFLAICNHEAAVKYWMQSAKQTTSIKACQFSTYLFNPNCLIPGGFEIAEATKQNCMGDKFFSVSTVKDFSSTYSCAPA